MIIRIMNTILPEWLEMAPTHVGHKKSVLKAEPLRHLKIILKTYANLHCADVNHESILHIGG